MRAIVMLLLRELISAGAFSGIVKLALDSGVGSGVRERALDTLRKTVRANLKRIVGILIASLLLLVALGFLVSAFFLFLLGQFSPPVAAAIVGGLFLALGCGILWYSLRVKKPEPVPVEPASEQQSSPLSSFINMAKSALGNVKGEIGDVFKGAESKQSWLLLGLLFMLGVWLGSQGKDDEA